MRHSFGRTVIQLLFGRGLEVAGITIDSAPTEGVRVTPLSRIRSLLPFLANPANRRRAVSFPPARFHNSFTNMLDREESDAVHERYHVPAPGRWVWDYGPIADLRPGHQENWVDYGRDDRRHC
jgi:hypothetical protein